MMLLQRPSENTAYILNLTLHMLANFACFICHLLFFFKNQLLKNYFKTNIRVSNSLDPGQAQHYVGSDLSLNHARIQKVFSEGVQLILQGFFWLIRGERIQLPL